MAEAGQTEAEYVIVGSGAGGGTLAARLAEAGRTVLLLEAGSDPRETAGGVPGAPGNRMPDDYDVPAFHPFASENDAISWDFFVRHYADDELQRRDPKYRPDQGGVLYPRAGTLGGCTAHNAMILVCPHDADWDAIASLTGDPSWGAGPMQAYFQRLEDCRHRPLQRQLARIGIDRTGHGWDGWLTTEKCLPRSVLGDERLLRTILASARIAFDRSGDLIERLKRLIQGAADPNDKDLVRSNAEGVRYTPLTTRDHRRIGSRERVLDVAARFPDRLRLELNALVTRVLFDDGNRAVGVEYLKGERLYRAHRRPNDEPGERLVARASREVVLSGGAFNTPQLLMLSGIGARTDLEKHGIDVRVDLPGVGRNLQDRYEVCVVSRMNFDHWEALADARFSTDDRLYKEWAAGRGGLYATNGAGLAVIQRSKPERPIPDLFLMALLGRFAGYFPGYARHLAENLNYLSWAILKAHTENRAGTITLRSADPCDPPSVNFHFFEEGDDKGGSDLDAVVEGIRSVRRITDRLREEELIAQEEMPGPDLQSDAQLKDYVRANAWGHHASCSCAIGDRSAGGVLDGRLRVHGVQGLRVVDASVFPRIPGFFIASAVYMVGEKAADMILADAAKQGVD
ncbi:MAG TPA: GMC family oxidoreductase [Geminicoccus sp.]|jgi:choline dehydrogenase-like flavoprotein|uniref:GMC family oxidoreductase n=1 Tax=Geminicoccus sp. TaxID=2024832 RepID=UPI002E30F5E4|nr:GMC family oxidoreductase [Geminicoccus sp.]HEX2528030.1 GMC family oxidoreductase [Geminicoccus sp.]